MRRPTERVIGVRGCRAATAALLTAAAVAAHAGCDPAAFVVAIDPGHSREQPGASSARGVPEWRFNQALAARVMVALRRAGFERTFLTTRDGEPMALDARAAVANARHADAFVSLHHDSAQPSRLQTWVVRGQPRYYTDTLSGHSLFVSRRNGDPDGSLRLARLLGRELRGLCLRPTAHHAEPIAGEGRAWLDEPLGIYRFDDLVVLRSTRMPAVLLEAGLIVNRGDERRLARRDRQDLVAGAVVRAVRAFCAGEPPAARDAPAPTCADDGRPAHGR